MESFSGFSDGDDDGGDGYGSISPVVDDTAVTTTAVTTKSTEPVDPIYGMATGFGGRVSSDKTRHVKLDDDDDLEGGVLRNAAVARGAVEEDEGVLKAKSI